MPKVIKRIREQSWWMEPNEAQLHDDTKLNEAYDPARLLPGYDGRNGPDVKQMYAGKDARFDNLGSTMGDNVSKSKKGAQDTADLTVKEGKKRVAEAEFGDEFGGEEGMNDEVPPEMAGDDMAGDEMGDEMGDEGMADEVADDVTVEIQGQKFKLVPVEDEFADEDEGEGEGDFGDDGMNGGEEGMEPPVAAEDKDLTMPESVRKAKNEKSAYVKKLLNMKAFAEGKLKELFTGDYVMIKQGLAGFDFTAVTGDKDFAVVDRAATGQAYTVTDSKSPYEPGSDSKGQSKKGKVIKTAQPSKESFKKWLSAQNQMNEEGNVKAVDPTEDPGETANQFNVQDEFSQTDPRSPLDPMKYPSVPEERGINPEMITQTDTMNIPNGKSNKDAAKESTVNRLAALKKARMARRQEGTQPKMESMEEELNFKDLISGKYSKRISE